MSAIKTTRLEEKLKNQESYDARQNTVDPQNDLSLISINVASSKGFGRSKSPKVAGETNIQALRKEHRKVLKELKNQIDEKDDVIREILLEKEETDIRINELERDNEFLHEQVDLVQREKETSIQLLETQIKRQENEYMQHINILDSEKQNAKSMLSHLQSVIKSGEVPKDPIITKLNFSVCLDRSDSNSKLTKFHALTTPCSPSQNRVNINERKNNPLQLSSNKKITSDMKYRSRNPSSCSINVRGVTSNTLHKDLYRSGHLKSLKQLALAQHMTTQNNDKEALAWFEQNIEGTHNEVGYTLDSSRKNGENPYKRSNKSRSKADMTSDGGKGINHISDIHPSSKGQYEDVNGTLMNSIVNLFPNKFRSKKGSGSGQNDNNNPVSSFSSSPRASMSKQELEHKLEQIKRSREDSRIHNLKNSMTSDDMVTESIDRTNFYELRSKRGCSPDKVINRNSYLEMLENGEIMKNINGDVLCKKCNREFTIDELITDLSHWTL